MHQLTKIHHGYLHPADICCTMPSWSQDARLISDSLASIQPVFAELGFMESTLIWKEQFGAISLDTPGRKKGTKASLDAMLLLLRMLR